MSPRLRILPLLLALAACSAPTSSVRRAPSSSGPWHLVADETAPELTPEAARAELDKLVAAYGLAPGDFAASAVSLPKGEALWELEPERPMIPASNMKLPLSAAALDLLGPDFRFRTELKLEGGKLYVEGHADPSIEAADFKAMLARLRDLRGKDALKEFGGDVVLDDSDFPVYDRIDPDFLDSAWSNTSYGALAVDHSRVTLQLAERPGKGLAALVAPDPEGFAVEIASRPLSFEPHYKPQYSVSFDEGRGLHVITLYPPLEPGRFTLPVRRASEHFGRVFARVARSSGVEVRSVARGTTPRGARPLLSRPSRPLRELLRAMNLESDNQMAEHLVLALAAKTGGRTREDGLAALSRFLVRKAGWKEGSFVVPNGSGLSRAARVSPAQLTRLLTYMRARRDLDGALESSLPIAGWSGTLRRRLVGSSSVLRIAGKSGMIDYVHSVSGYGVDAGGRPFAFALMANDAEGLRRTAGWTALQRESEAEWKRSTDVNERFKELEDRALEVLLRVRTP
ncbi:MAG: D-alanyl-D-alanine carboxypeptidase/D-alanyl-D-alanine-endopeptidase [Elusimicrobiota bacterium]|jgi:D-alanyl-D-alanine carboxypeptidase/D-alanyl-D-alanine-endopeptidase (penicillin-binding protein 4)